MTISGKNKMFVERKYHIALSPKKNTSVFLPDMLYIVKESVSNMQSRASERSPR
jgi:hypothetical protein